VLRDAICSAKELEFIFWKGYRLGGVYRWLELIADGLCSKPDWESLAFVAFSSSETGVES